MSAVRAFVCAVAVVVLLACSISEATSLGCFATDQVTLLPQKGSFTEQSCKALCASDQLQLPLYGLYCGTKCACSASIPDVAAQATGCSATASAATCGATIELQYIHSGSTDACELAPYPLTADKLNLRTGPERTSFDGGAMTLATRGWESTQAETRDVMKYGLHEVKIKAAIGIGPVTAFYLIDQLTFPPAQQDEIDLEFLNAGKLVSEPNIFWTNVWAYPEWENVRDSNMTSTALGRTLGDPSFSTTSALHTYLLDWQPGYVRWYIEGVLVDQMTLQDGPIPKNPMYAIFSLWTLTNGNCEWFGGCVSGPDANFTAQFADLKRVRCYDPVAPYHNTTLAAWLLDNTTDTTPVVAPSPATSPAPSPASPATSPTLSPASPVASPATPGDSPAASPTPLAPCPPDASPSGSGSLGASTAGSAGAVSTLCTRSTPGRSPPGAVDIADATVSPAAASISPEGSRSAVAASGSRRSLPLLGPAAALSVAVIFALLQAV